MPLRPGTSLGSYTITAPLGAGGMGEVYRARDTKLQRDVAIKVLPAALADDPGRLARFEREAQVLAALNHPHIGAIYGLVEAGLQPRESGVASSPGPESVTALVLELVEGPTLADRLAQGAIPLAEAIPVARQIAEALEAAHEAGIIHRDLKPANIKLRPDGTVKVLDFGLAKAIESYAGPNFGSARTDASPVAGLKSGPTYAGTEAGMILGTAPYMAPEQARGRAVDKRADIWAFGVVLWEMLTGRRLFEGETVSDTLAAVLTKTPDLAALPEATPTVLRQLVARCLDRDLSTRLRDIGEARIALAGDLRATTAVSMPRSRAGLPRLALVGALCALVAGALTWVAMRGRDAAPLPASRAVIASRPGGAVIRTPAVSPDGRAVAFESSGRLWLQRLDQWEPRELPGTEGGGSPFWSPDSRWIGFFTDRQLMRVSEAGGAPAPICALSVRAGRAGAPYRSGGVWRGDGTIVFTTEPGPALEETTTDVFTTEFGPLYEVPSSGGDARAAIQPPRGVLDFHEPDALPGRSELVVSLHRATGRDAIGVVSRDGAVRVLFERRGTEFRRPRYSPTGHLLYHQIDGDATLVMNRIPTVWAVAFSLGTLETTGAPFLVDAGGWPSVADEGTLVMVSPPARVARQLASFDLTGRVTATVGPAREWREALSISPSGTRLLSADEDGIWVSALDGGSRSRLTRGPGDSMPAWVGEHTIAFTRDVDGVLSVMMKHADLSAPEETLATRARYPTASLDGRYLMFNQLGDTAGSWQPAWTDLRAGRTVQTMGGSHLGGRFPSIAPNGRFVLYTSAETGRDEVYVTRFPDGLEKWQVSTDGGGWTFWGPGSDQIYYRRGGRESALMAVSLTGVDAPGFGAPRQLFEWNEHWAPFFALARDGRHGLTFVPVGPVHALEGLRVIRGWAGAATVPR